MLRRRAYVFAAAALAAWVLASGCGDDGAEEQDGGSRRLLLFCGAGIRPPLAEIVDTFNKQTGLDVAVDYAGHQFLLSKIKLGRQGDIYMPGDKRYVDLASEEGLIVSRRPICYFVPTIFVQKGNPSNIRGLGDLVRPGVRLGLGDVRACAIGRKCREIFQKNDIPWGDVERNLQFQSATVNELGMQIQAQSLDAVIVWDAVAKYYARYGDEVVIPPEQNVVSTVDAGILKFTRNRAAAERFVTFLTSDRGRRIFRKHQYRVDAPK